VTQFINQNSYSLPLNYKKTLKTSELFIKMSKLSEFSSMCQALTTALAERNGAFLDSETGDVHQTEYDMFCSRLKAGVMFYFDYDCVRFHTFLSLESIVLEFGLGEFSGRVPDDVMDGVFKAGNKINMSGNLETAFRTGCFSQSDFVCLTVEFSVHQLKKSIRESTIYGSSCSQEVVRRCQVKREPNFSSRCEGFILYQSDDEVGEEEYLRLGLEPVEYERIGRLV
jgi:hypothetical protein